MRIAYVEDNVANLALVERVARMNQHTIVSFSEGEVAIQELVRQKFDLILMDIELAGEMGGLQVVQYLRNQGIVTPIIAVTAYAMMGDRERFLEVGCNDYLPKPLPIAEFLVLLAKYDTAKQDTQAASQVAPAAVVSPSPAPQTTPAADATPVIAATSTSAPAAAISPSPAPQTIPAADATPAIAATSTPASTPVVSPSPAPQTTPAADATPVVEVTSSPTDGTPAVSPSPAPVQPASVQPTLTPAPVASAAPAQPPAPTPMPPLREEDTATKPIPWLAGLRAAARANNNPANDAASGKPPDAATAPAAAPAAPAQKDTPNRPTSEPVPDQPAPSKDVPPTRVP